MERGWVFGREIGAGDESASRSMVRRYASIPISWKHATRVLLKNFVVDNGVFVGMRFVTDKVTAAKFREVSSESSVIGFPSQYQTPAN